MRKTSAAGKNGFVLIAVDVQDPGNLGSLIRAGEAGGVTGVLVCGASASPFSWKAVRGSMGSILRLPVAAGLIRRRRDKLYPEARWPNRCGRSPRRAAIRMRSAGAGGWRCSLAAKARA